jgi:hypothetical protein
MKRNLYLYRQSLTSPLPDISESTSSRGPEGAKNAAGDELRVNLTHRNEKTHSLRDGGNGTEGIQ